MGPDAGEGERRRLALRRLVDGLGGDVARAARDLGVGRWRVRAWLSGSLAVDDARWPALLAAAEAAPASPDPPYSYAADRERHPNRVRWLDRPSWHARRPVVAAAIAVRSRRRSAARYASGRP